MLLKCSRSCSLTDRDIPISKYGFITPLDFFTRRGRTRRKERLPAPRFAQDSSIDTFLNINYLAQLKNTSISLVTIWSQTWWSMLGEARVTGGIGARTALSIQCTSIKRRL